MPDFHHSVAVLPLPFRRCVNRCRFHTPLPLRIFFAFYGCNGTQFLQNNGILQRQNGQTATEWWKPGITGVTLDSLSR